MMTLPLANVTITPIGCLRFAVAVMLLYVGALILAPFSHYLPPDFGSGFLGNKERFFYSSGYYLGFYAHILSAPVVLLCGTLQFSTPMRTRWPRLHRTVGRIYTLLMLTCVAPGGAIMAIRAFGGWSTTLCFALISLLAWVFTFVAWRQAKAKRYALHGRWMCRSFIMLCSAILLRMIHTLLQPVHLDPTTAYQIAAWLSWVPALAIFESTIWVATRGARTRQQSTRRSAHGEASTQIVSPETTRTV